MTQFLLNVLALCGLYFCSVCSVSSKSFYPVDKKGCCGTLRTFTFRRCLSKFCYKLHVWRYYPTNLENMGLCIREDSMYFNVRYYKKPNPLPGRCTCKKEAFGCFNLPTTEPTTATPTAVSEPETASPEPMTAEPTSSSELETTTLEPTTIEPTSPEPTTTEPTTSPEPTTTEQITSPEPTTEESTTSPEPSTTEPTTSPEPTTTEQTTSPEPTTTEQITSPEPTTEEPTTSPEPTTAESTSPEPTTTEPTTSLEPTTTELATSLEPTTTEPTTSLEPTTVEPTTSLEPETTESTASPEPETTELTTSIEPETDESTATTTKVTMLTTSTTTQPVTTTSPPVCPLPPDVLGRILQGTALDECSISTVLSFWVHSTQTCNGVLGYNATSQTQSIYLTEFCVFYMLLHETDNVSPFGLYKEVHFPVKPATDFTVYPNHLATMAPPGTLSQSECKPMPACLYDPDTMSDLIDFSNCYIASYGSNIIVGGIPISTGPLNKVEVTKQASCTTKPGTGEGAVDCFVAGKPYMRNCWGDNGAPVFCHLTGSGEEVLYGLVDVIQPEDKTENPMDLCATSEFHVLPIS